MTSSELAVLAIRSRPGGFLELVCFMAGQLRLSGGVAPPLPLLLVSGLVGSGTVEVYHLFLGYLSYGGYG